MTRSLVHEVTEDMRITPLQQQIPSLWRRAFASMIVNVSQARIQQSVCRIVADKLI